MRTAWCAGPRASGSRTELVEALFTAHFTDGSDIGDITFLTGLAVAFGLDGARPAPSS